MGKTFITGDFMLHGKTAKVLYHDFAEAMPIFDYHCHLQPKDIAENRRFDNLTQIWLGGDHYKWRAMRTNGVDERFITGDADDEEKFKAWAETVPFTVRNPLYHWTHLELRNPFGYTKLLEPQTAMEAYQHCNRLLQTEPFRVRGLMEHFNVKIVCTTDDPTDSLEYHKALAADSNFGVKVLPAFRPDKAMAVESPELFNAWVGRLEKASAMSIHNYREFLEALRKRHQFFHEMGCRLSDHALEAPYAADYTETEIETIFQKVRGGATPDPAENVKFKAAMMYEFGVMNAEKGWTMQLHMNALRNVNSRLLKLLGPDTGFDTIGDFLPAQPLARFLDRLDKENHLPKTILYSLNPMDNEVLATVIGCFQDGSVPGKLQFGSAWWFNDQKDGMKRQIEALSQMGLLSRFVGMLTDSRSFLSYPRHDYFRRILCDMMGQDVENGELPDDTRWLGKIVQDICYNNAVRYFGIEGK
ncbi:MAG TPA: glucuronate isomerase [Bacillota bacterium]